LHREPSDQLIERLNDEFQDVVESGRIKKTKMHKIETDDEHLRELPRIAFTFNRRAVGRLRQMVDMLNLELGGD